jgi:hypothetical protein
MSTTLELCFPNNHQFTGTALGEQGFHCSIGQINMEDESAKLVYVFPHTNEKDGSLAILLDCLIKQSGEMGAKRLITTINDDEEFFSVLRYVGFCQVCNQQVWENPATTIQTDQSQDRWQTTTEKDLPSIRALYKKIAPAVVQASLPLSASHFPGLIMREDGNITGFAEVHMHEDNIFIIPHVLSSGQNKKTLSSLSIVFHRSRKKIYFCIRSYQPWLDTALEATARIIGRPQSILVKHLTHAVKVTVEDHHPVAVRNHHAEPTTPIMPAAPRDKC